MVKDNYLIDWVEKTLSTGRTTCLNTNDTEIVAPNVNAQEAAILKERYLQKIGYEGIKVKVINVPLLVTISE
jgi:hypothetical protein